MAQALACRGELQFAQRDFSPARSVTCAVVLWRACRVGFSRHYNVRHNPAISIDAARRAGRKPAKAPAANSTARNFINIGLNGGGHLFRGIEGTVHAAVLNIFVGLGQTGVDHAALGRGVFIVSSGDLRAIDDELGGK